MMWQSALSSSVKFARFIKSKVKNQCKQTINSDKIYVINNGLVVGEGKHEELIKSSEIYKNFYEKQIRKY